MDKKEIMFRENMAELGFYNIFLMKGCIVCDFKNFQTDGTILSRAGIMFYVEEEEIEIEKEWIGTCVYIKLEKLNKAFKLIKEFYSEN